MRSARCAAGAPPRPPGSRWNADATRRSAATRSGRRSSNSDGKAVRDRRRHASADPEPARAPPRGIARRRSRGRARSAAPTSRTRARAVARDRDRRRPAPRPARPLARWPCASAPGPAAPRRPCSLPPRSVAAAPWRRCRTRAWRPWPRATGAHRAGRPRWPAARRRPTPLSARTRPQRSSSQPTSPAMPGPIVGRIAPDRAAAADDGDLRVQERARLDGERHGDVNARGGRFQIEIVLQALRDQRFELRVGEGSHPVGVHDASRRELRPASQAASPSSRAALPVSASAAGGGCFTAQPDAATTTQPTSTTIG